ncbi:12124_t:CDS:2, partial [Cetraspora pellucida]
LEELSTKTTLDFITNKINHSKNSDTDTKHQFISSPSGNLSADNHLEDHKNTLSKEFKNNQDKSITIRINDDPSNDLVISTPTTLTSGDDNEIINKKLENIIDPLETIINEYKIDIHDYNEFTNVSEISKNLHSQIECATWKNRGLTVAIKSLIKIEGESAIRNFAREERPNIQEVFKVLQSEPLLNSQIQIQTPLLTTIEFNDETIQNNPVQLHDETLLSNVHEPKSDSISNISVRLRDEVSLSSIHEPKNESEEYLIKQVHFDHIFRWINQTSRKGFRKIFPSKSKNSHTFKLLIRGSRDGFTPASFHEKCDNKGPTLTILKIKGENSILGGYNPLDWKSPKEEKQCITNKSFIFNLDLDNPNKSIF